MNSLKTLLFFCIVLVISACDHPLQIKGQGDITSLTGQRDCSLEQFQAGSSNCSRNTVQGEYIETYTAQPRSGWVFNGWENYCTTAATNSCSFSIPADVVQQSYGAAIPPLVAVFTPEADPSNPYFLDQATPEYSATRVLQSSAGTFTMMEYATPQKQRIEFEAQGQVTAMINRSDKNVSWILYPSLKRYMEIDSERFDKQTGGDIDEIVSYEKVGTETVQGFLTDKYKVTIKNPDSRGEGFFWLTRTGLLVQMEMTITKDDGTQEKFLMFLKNLIIALQPASLFEIPGDFQALPSIPGIPGLPQGG